MSDKRGFTLIELLIVIIIIGVLATLALPQYTTFVERARAAEALSMIAAMKPAEAAYKLDSGYYTTDLTKLAMGNIYTTEPSATAAGQYWSYTGYNWGGSSATGYGIQANRTGKAAGDNTKNIIFIWSDDTGAGWTGNHYGVPKTQ